MNRWLRRSRSDGDQPFDKKGDLAFEVRAEICASLGDGDARPWCSLEIESAAKVLPIWSARYPATQPFDLLSASREALMSDTDKHRLVTGASTFKTVVDDLIYESHGRNMAPLYAGMAAVAAAQSVVHGPPRPFLPELTANVEDWPASFLASIAAAGAATWERPSGSSDARREFWAWYLSEVDARR